MPIQFSCPQGHVLRVPDHLQGKVIKCPKCQAQVLVTQEPTPEEATPEESLTADDPFASLPSFFSDAPAAEFGGELADLSEYMPTASPQPQAAPGYASAAGSGWLPPAAKAAPEPSDSLTTNKVKLGVSAAGFSLGAVLGCMALGLMWIFGAYGTGSSVDIAEGPQLTSREVDEALRKMRQIELAFFNYEDAKKRFPPGAPLKPGENSSATRSGLSWRVHLLPYLGHGPLYNRFKLDEPWDSQHNRQLLDKIPEVYRLSGQSDAKTRFQVIQSDNTLFGNDTIPRFNNMPDGIANTLFAVVVGADRAVPWTCPTDFAYDPGSPIASLGTLRDGVIVCGVGDRALVIGNNVHPKDFVALATARGGDIVDAQSVSLSTINKTMEELVAELNAKYNPPLASLRPDIVEVNTKLEKLWRAFKEYAMFHTDLAKVPSAGAKQDDSSLKNSYGLSWRVHMLRYLGHADLAAQFHLNEPWDSEHNKKLLDKMPDVYRLGNEPGSNTRLQIICGPKMLFGSETQPTLKSITDGPVNTILAVVVGSDEAVPWTCPKDFEFDTSAPIKSLGKQKDGAIFCLMADGKVTLLPTSIDAQDFNALATPRGSEIVDVQRWAMKLDQFAVKTTAAPASSATARAGGSTTPATTAVSNATANSATRGASPSAGSQPSSPVGARYSVQQQVQLAAFGMLAHQDQFLGYYSQPFVPDTPGAELSWRVHILPYLGEQALYDKFNFQEGWDGPTNRPLLDAIPACFQTGNGNKTRIRSFADRVGVRSTCMASAVKDTPQKTILTLAVGDNLATEWTKPEDLPSDAPSVAEILNGLQGKTVDVVLADGTPLALSANGAAQHLAALATMAGGEAIDIAALRTQNGNQGPTSDRQMLEVVGKRLTYDRSRVKKLKSLIDAMLNFEASYRSFPPAKTEKFGPEGKPFLSWRVHLLPYIDQANLYKQFKLDEPWDSPHNSKLLALMPEVYRDPEATSRATTTSILLLSGKGTMFSEKYGPKLREIRDGTGTYAMVWAGRDKEVLWTRPDDLAFDPAEPIACLGKLDSNVILCAAANGRINTLKTIIPGAVFAGLVSPDGNEPEPPWLQAYGHRN